MTDQDDNVKLEFPSLGERGRDAIAGAAFDFSAEPLEEAFAQLEDRARVVGQLLRRQLDNVRTFHDLTQDQLLAVQRTVKQLKRSEVAPSPAEFWAHTANPLATNLVEASTIVIDGEANEMTRAIQRYAILIGTYVRENQSSLATADQSVDESASGSATELVSYFSGRIHHAIEVMFAEVPTDDSINELGAWWQERLRRHATRRSFPKSLFVPTSQVPLLISKYEMQLLDRAPWSHGDRLLSAFELAHSDVRHGLADTQRDLRRRSVAMVEAALRPSLPPSNPVDRETPGLGAADAGAPNDTENDTVNGTEKSQKNATPANGLESLLSAALERSASKPRLDSQTIDLQ